MTVQQFEKAQDIYKKIRDTNNELSIFKEMAQHGSVVLIRDIHFPDAHVYSDVVRNYLCRENVYTDIVKILEERIRLFEKELEEL